MAEAFREVTDWGPHEVPNHTYFLEGDKMFGYLPKGRTEPHYFKVPIVIDMRRRKFSKVSPNPFTMAVKDASVIEVKGSKGDLYYVNTVEKTCTCPGFLYHKGVCRHLTERGLI